jgi:hypothetical protein
MAHNKDYVPDRDGDFDGWLANLAAYVEAKTAGGGWTHIPAEKVTALKDYGADFQAKLRKLAGPHTSVDTEAKTEARKAAEQFARRFVQQYLKYEPVTDEDRTAMNVHNKDTTHTAIERPATRALITELKALGGFRAELRFQDEASPERRAIPYGMNGCLLSYAVGPEKETDYAALARTALMTHAPFTLQLGPEAEAQFLSCACRWQNEKGELGPWGEIQHVAVS